MGQNIDLTHCPFCKQLIKQNNFKLKSRYYINIFLTYKFNGIRILLNDRNTYQFLYNESLKSKIYDKPYNTLLRYINSLYNKNKKSKIYYLKENKELEIKHDLSINKTTNKNEQLIQLKDEEIIKDINNISYISISIDGNDENNDDNNTFTIKDNNANDEKDISYISNMTNLNELKKLTEQNEDLKELIQLMNKPSISNNQNNKNKINQYIENLKQPNSENLNNKSTISVDIHEFIEGLQTTNECEMISNEIIDLSRTYNNSESNNISKEKYNIDDQLSVNISAKIIIQNQIKYYY